MPKITNESFVLTLQHTLYQNEVNTLQEICKVGGRVLAIKALRLKFPDMGLMHAKATIDELCE